MGEEIQIGGERAIIQRYIRKTDRWRVQFGSGEVLKLSERLMRGMLPPTVLLFQSLGQGEIFNIVKFTFHCL